MKVWELCNLIKESDASLADIRGWVYENKNCPVKFALGLESDSAELPKLQTIAYRICSEHECEMECLDDFLDTEVSE